VSSSANIVERFKHAFEVSVMFRKRCTDADAVAKSSPPDPLSRRERGNNGMVKRRSLCGRSSEGG
jgi:hypothetical protein